LEKGWQKKSWDNDGNVIGIIDCEVDDGDAGGI
jgi:hypothetical protein